MAHSISSVNPVQRPVPCDAIHVGMPKCGSTFLQMVGFAMHPEINLIWEPGMALFFELRDKVGQPDFDVSDFATRLSEYIRQRGQPKDQKTVLSFEGFCGFQTTNRNDWQLANTLCSITGSPTVIVMIREQASFLNSLWCQYIKEGGVLSLEKFLNAPDSPAQPTEQVSIYGRVCFDRYIKMLYELFGAHRVHVLLFEEMRTDFDAFCRRLFRALGVADDWQPPNHLVRSSPNPFHANLMRLLNRMTTTKRNAGVLPYAWYLTYRRWYEQRILPSRRWNPPRRRNAMKFVSPDRQTQIQESNRRLAEMLNLDLAAYGYDLGAKVIRSDGPMSNGRERERAA